jgi:hypothetical protein
MSKTIYLSPSNHGRGANLCLHEGCYEDKHTRPIALATAKYLKLSGFKVLIGAENENMAERCNASDKAGAVLHVPIHTNASGSKKARYLMFMAYNTTGKYKKIYNAVKPFMKEIYDGDIQFVTRKDLYEINAPNATTFYCEFGFHTNQKDCDEFIHNPEVIGKALAQGICAYYGATFKEDERETYPGTFPKMPLRGYLRKGDKSTQVLYLQKFLNWYGGYKLKEDKDYGPKTEAAVEDFQEREGLAADGEFGRKSLAKAKAVKR